MSNRKFSAGIDVGTECIKVVVVDDQGTSLGSSIVARRGYFQDRVSEAFPVALEDAQVDAANVSGICATGFAENCVPMATCSLGESACHALGAFHHHRQAMCVIDIGGRDPKAIRVDAQGRPTGIQTLRRCAAGIGTFLIFAARHLDVHPSHLQEMAARTDEACDVGSYCSMFSGQDILEKLRDGARLADSHQPLVAGGGPDQGEDAHRERNQQRAHQGDLSKFGDHSVSLSTWPDASRASATSGGM